MTDPDWHLIRNLRVNYEHLEHAEKSFQLHFATFSWVTCRADYHFMPHKHYLQYELIAPRGKSYQCSVNKVPVTVNPGQVVLIQPGDDHEDFYHEDGELIFMIFTLQDLAGKNWKYGIMAPEIPPPARVADLPPGSTAEQILDLLLQQKKLSLERMISLRKMLEAFFWEFVPSLPKSLLAPQFIAGMEEDVFRQQVFHCFDELIHEHFEVAKLSARLGMSKRSLEYRFREAFGTGPAQTFTAYRVRLAEQLLRQGKSVKTVAAQLGFQDQFYFSTVFKRVTGIPPSRLLRPC